MLPAQPNQSLIDGLACLQALAGAREAVGGRELGRQLGLEPTRVNRLLLTLAHLGLVERDERRKYRPGPAIHVLAAQAMFGSGLLRRAMGPLDSLRRFGLTVAMGVLWRDKVCYLYHGNAATPPAEALGRVGLYPAADSGIGHALLARLDDHELYMRLADHPRFDALLQHVRTARERGYAHVLRPDEGAQTLSIALADNTQAAIALAGRITPDRVEALVEGLREAAGRICADA